MSETKYFGLDELRKNLEANGWRISPNNIAHQMNLCNWYAWSTDRDGITPECACNEKPPSLVIYPNYGEYNGHRLDSLEIAITGETKTGEWLQFKAYGIKPCEFDAKWASIRGRLVAAWSAAAGMEVEA